PAEDERYKANALVCLAELYGAIDDKPTALRIVEPIAKREQRSDARLNGQLISDTIGLKMGRKPKYTDNLISSLQYFQDKTNTEHQILSNFAYTLMADNKYDRARTLLNRPGLRSYIYYPGLALVFCCHEKDWTRAQFQYKQLVSL